jgi:hypothetical protein
MEQEDEEGTKELYQGVLIVSLDRWFHQSDRTLDVSRLFLDREGHSRSVRRAAGRWQSERCGVWIVVQAGQELSSFIAQQQVGSDKQTHEHDAGHHYDEKKIRILPVFQLFGDLINFFHMQCDAVQAASKSLSDQMMKLRAWAGTPRVCPSLREPVAEVPREYL